MTKCGAFPGHFADVTDLMRTVGNLGSHADEENVDLWDAELLDDFFRALVEYVYITPSRIERFRQRLSNRGIYQGTRGDVVPAHLGIVFESTAMIDTLLQRLEELNRAHLEEGIAIMEAFGGTVYPFDLLAYAVLNRSISLTSGFIMLMRADNFVAATTLVRPQLDNFLRFAAGWLVADPHKFATEILGGIPVKKQKTQDGHWMNDRFLVDSFKTEHPWIERVYRETSGFIHLSEKHMLMTVESTNAGERSVPLSISDTHKHIPSEAKAEAIMGFSEITKLVLHRIYSWRYTKENPSGLEKG